jgi:hypothetical protein
LQDLPASAPDNQVHTLISHCLKPMPLLKTYATAAPAVPPHPPQAAASTTDAPAAPAAEGTRKLWGGRFTGKTDPLMEKFNESLPVDKRMWKEDIEVRYQC